jgi:Neuraminidase (sialidase)
MLRSTDGGLTWGERFVIPAYNLSGPIQLADGRILFAGTDPKKPAVWESKDEGLTWSVLALLPTRAGEMDMIESADGRLVLHVRGHVRDGKTLKGTFQTVSRDGGKTWSEPELIAAGGWPPNPIRLKDATLVTTYGVRSKPFGVRGKMSKDHGETWSDEFTVYGDGHDWDLGYPTTVELKDRTLLTVWYETMPDSPNAVLRQIKWKLP